LVWQALADSSARLAANVRSAPADREVVFIVVVIALVAWLVAGQCIG